MTAERARRERRRLTHFDRAGRPRMVDVSAKPPTARRAVAEALLAIEPATISLIVDGELAKGDLFTVAELAGVMAGKRTAELVPLAHPIPLTDLQVEIKPDRAAGGLRIRATAATVAPTGVEMEALVAAAAAALTAYDMVKSVDRGAVIHELRLVEKSGGRSGEWRREAEASPPAARAVGGGRRPPARRGAGRQG